MRSSIKQPALFIFSIALTAAATTAAHADGGFFGSVLNAVNTVKDKATQAKAGAQQLYHQVKDQVAPEPQSSEVPSPELSPAPAVSPPPADPKLESSVLFSADFPLSTRIVKIEIVLNGSPLPLELMNIPVASGGHFEKRIYFLHGPGRYKFDVFYSDNPDRYQDVAGVKFLEEKTFTNSETSDLSYLLPSGDVQSDDPAIVALAQEKTAGATTDLEKAKAIHDWIGNTIQYDAASYFDGSYAHKVYDASSIFTSHLAICYGYSNLFAAMARAVGLKAKVINGAIIWPSLGQSWEKQGQSQVHAWNEVLIDGRWVTVDTTWDSGSMDFTTHQFTQSLQSKYFDPAVDVFAVDHQKIGDDVNN